MSKVSFSSHFAFNNLTDVYFLENIYFNKKVLENSDIDKKILENIDIDKEILENNGKDKENLQNIDIDMILYRLELGILKTPTQTP